MGINPVDRAVRELVGISRQADPEGIQETKIDSMKMIQPFLS